MLGQPTSLDHLHADFRWDIPHAYNMGVDVCDKWAATDPERVAIIDLECGSRITFAQLKKMSDTLAMELRAKGIGFGDPVGVLRSQSAWTAAAHIAIWKLGAISMPLFGLFRAEALKMRLSDSAAKVVVSEPDFAQNILGIRRQLPDLAHVIIPETMADRPALRNFVPEQTSAEDPALLIYTSGTTGDPKGALLAQRVLLGHLPGVEMSHNFLPQASDRFWTPADWAWIGGLLDVLMPALHHGISVVAKRMAKFDAQACKQLIEENAVRNVFFPPTVLKVLKSEQTQIKGLRSVASGGEPLGEELLAWGRTALGLEINEFYGQTECNMTVSACGDIYETPAGSTGRAVIGHRVSVLDADGNETMEEGEIAVHRDSPSMMLKYWKNPIATSDKYSSDWMLTGDRGVLRDGFVYFLGRDDDVISSAGYRIGPSMIENCLLGHPAVLMAAVVGKPDESRGEIVKAYVKIHPDFKANSNLEQELKDWVRSRLAAHEYPREVSFVEDLPMTITGKIIRKILKQRACAEAEN
ncbi:AMP-dependent synthetase [Amylibacter marinus]|uniref:AMP-dependent synthetase n=2 Tax=Amylibacter marinus TaxID=1475483 RepID=A0ABQ5VVJ4_9RHOB|nr:AMP-dependent synthetase [Amylibacter marinus]